MSGKPIYNPGQIFALKEKTDLRAKELSKEGALLKIDITALEKERRHMHTLLCDLIYYLEEDSKYNSTKINAIISSSIKFSSPTVPSVPDEVAVNLSDPAVGKLIPPPKSALKKPTTGSRSNTINLGKLILVFEDALSMKYIQHT